MFQQLQTYKVKTERVEHCIDAQSLCLGFTQVKMSPTCLPFKTSKIKN